MFNVIDLSTGQPYPELVVEPEVYETGSLAAERAKYLTELLGRKFQPRPAKLAVSVDWRAREAARITSGEYLALLPEVAALCPADHFAHVSKGKPEAIAFTSSDDKGNRDLQTRLGVATYIERFAPHITQSERERMASAHALHFATIDLQFAYSADDIEAVYTNYCDDTDGVTDSCMRYPARNFDSSEHPVRAYSGPDLAIAYLANDDGQTISRALVWPDNKVYSRVYGEGRIHDMLKALGYQKSGYYGDGNGSFNGARLTAIEHEDASDIYVVPYCDDVSSAHRNGRYLVLGNGDLDMRNTNGLSGEPREQGYCENCEENCDPDEMRNVYTMINNRGRITGEQAWCDHCADNNTFFCHGFAETVSDNVDQCEVDGNTYCQQYASDNFTCCDHTEEYTSETCHEVNVGRGNTETWCQSACDDDAFQCEHDGEYYANELREHGITSANVAKCNAADWLEANPPETDSAESVAIIGRDEHADQLELTLA